LGGVAGFILGAVTLLPTVATDLLAPARSPWLAAYGLSVWQIGMFVITALLTIMVVQSLTAMMRDWLIRLPEDHRPSAISFVGPITTHGSTSKVVVGAGGKRRGDRFCCCCGLQPPDHGQTGRQ
jgi:hypothetical protein